MTTETGLTGLLFVGDPHLATHAPGFRKDDYPAAAAEKLRWAIRYARRERLLPILLGDIFHWPRDNGNRLLVDLMELFDGGVIGIYGNHDCSEDTLGPADTLSVLVAAGRYRLLSADGPWRGRMNGTDVVVGGTSWRGGMPAAFDKSGDPGRRHVVFWTLHHDVLFPGYEQASRASCREIPRIDVVVNGHIHRPLDDVVTGNTTWLNPGNIIRIKRAEFERARVPSVLRVDISPDGWAKRSVPVPHAPFDDVFHRAAGPLGDEEELDAGSAFVRGLADLEAVKTAGGAGLRAFLDENLGQFGGPVADEIRSLAKEVLHDDQSAAAID